MYHDPIADLLTRVKNAGSAKLSSCNMPSSTVKVDICRVLKEEGYITDYEVVDLGSNKTDLKVTVKYFQDQPVIEGLVRVSKVSCRIYVKASEIPAIKGGLGITILSTPQGVMTGRKARQANVGGELICKVW